MFSRVNISRYTGWLVWTQENDQDLIFSVVSKLMGNSRQKKNHEQFPYGFKTVSRNMFESVE